ncbi:hypothetical protein F0562_000877 [Nyssa sinensis]|uniref:EF-hand domain-containing protein n=1 Tax=Nyssa sinensis TaxID=561372 RepID=A0A5J5C1C8_9ASTE|nr:hypothetical protein F0562_000877 [Nyssa sinensis]
MAERLGGEGLIDELCKGYRLLMDGEKEVITFESLKRNSALLGLQDLRDDEIQSMVREGDLDGDGALNQMEFCVLMFRLTTSCVVGKSEKALLLAFNCSFQKISILIRIRPLNHS